MYICSLRNVTEILCANNASLNQRKIRWLNNPGPHLLLFQGSGGKKSHQFSSLISLAWKKNTKIKGSHLPLVPFIRASYTFASLNRRWIFYTDHTIFKMTDKISRDLTATSRLDSPIIPVGYWHGSDCWLSLAAYTAPCRSYIPSSL